MAGADFRPMDSAPRDGTEVWIKTKDRGEVHAYFLDCGWLRQEVEVAPGKIVASDLDVTDCWRITDENGDPTGDDIELDEALGWAPVDKEG